MQEYTHLNNLLLTADSTFQEFQTAIKSFSIYQQTYLNLFLITVVSHKTAHPDFHKYVWLLTHFKQFTAKKSANINYIGYKDRKSVLMHACQRGTPRSIEALLEYKVQPQVRDPLGKTAAFYAVRNPNQEHANGILICLLNRFPNVLTLQSVSGATVLNEAIQLLRYSTIQLLLRRGANPNTKMRDTGNTVAHQVLRHYQTNKEIVHSILLLLARYKINFEQPNGEGIKVCERARAEGINFEQYLSFCTLLEKDESVVESIDNDFDKMSFTTLNQQTKIGDTASQICQSDSNIYSVQVDFSQLDQQQLEILKENNQANSEVNSEESHIQSETQEPIDFLVLSSQICQFSNMEEQKHADMIPIAQSFFAEVYKIVKKYNLAIQIVGSFATGLWTPLSDIDISLTPRSNQYIDFQVTLQKIYKKLKSKKIELGIEDFYFIKGKINSIKLNMGQKYHFLQFDISIFHRNHQNKHYVTYITESLTSFPQIRPLFFVYRHVCQLFGIHDPQAGGLKTYALFLMISSVVKSMPTKNIGELFYHIALYYGFYFEYKYQDVCIRANQTLQDILEYPDTKFNFMDPLNLKNNVGGKNIKTRQMQNMLRAIYYWMSQPVSAPYLSQVFQLNNII